MSKRIKLRKLLDRRATTGLLADFAVVWGVHLAVCDHQGRLNAGNWDVAPDAPWEQLTSEKASPHQGENWAAWPLLVDETAIGFLLVMTIESDDSEQNLSYLIHQPVAVRPLLKTLDLLISEGIAKRAIAQETLERYREINLLYNIGETIGACLDMDELSRLVLAESVKIIDARRGAVLLLDEKKQRLDQAISVGKLSPETTRRAHRLALDVVDSGKPKIVNDFEGDAGQRMPIVCAPLRFRDLVLGAIILADKSGGGDFTAGDEKLLLALASQAAVAVENARLFESVKQQRDEIATMKNYMDNIFASVASGVITTDVNDKVTTFNCAAESIFAVSSERVLNQPYYQAMEFLQDTSLPNLIQNVRKRNQTYIDHEICPRLPSRGQVYLNMSLSRLLGTSDEPLGVTIVVDDVTEKKRFEREQAMVRRYLPAELLDNLPDDLAELGLLGERQVITTLFADIRGFTSFSEVNSPETVVEIINGHFAMAEQAVRRCKGIIDKYLGDAVMAVFNTPLLQLPDHAWQAVHAAWILKQAVEQYHITTQQGRHKKLIFGMGICTGEAVVGNVGAVDRMEYTAIGDSVNIAKRLQENAAGGQVVISHETWVQVQDRVLVKPMLSIQVKGRRNPVKVFELVGLKE